MGGWLLTIQTVRVDMADIALNNVRFISLPITSAFFFWKNSRMGGSRSRTAAPETLVDVLPLSICATAGALVSDRVTKSLGSGQ